MIRSTKHHFLSYTNTSKIVVLNEFLNEYRNAVQFYIDYLWNNDILFPNSNKVQFSIAEDLLFVPQFIDYKLYTDTKLSARALANAVKQALGIVRSRVAIRNKLKYIIQKRKEDSFPTEKWEEKLTKGQAILRKPIIKDNFSAELNINVFDIQEDTDKFFDLFIRLKSTGFNHLKLPIKYHSRNHKWIAKNGKLLNGILISKNYIQLRYDVPEPTKKTTGKTVGGDTGKKSILTLSDGTTTSKIDNHGHSFDSIMAKMSRKKKGSKAFGKVAAQRLNFINWSINQLNLNDIKHIKLEHIDNLFFKNGTSRLMSHFTNTLIEKKILNLAEETGVSVSLQTSTYRSQRCSSCGKVRKANRKGKEYKCDHCSFTVDADLNAATNHEIDLPDVPFALRQLKLNRSKGFFWKPDGFFDHTGRERIVLDAKKDK
jgi:transposase